LRTVPGQSKLTRIAVVVVTHNSADVVADCLASLPEGAKGVELTDVIVVDNASGDESLRIAKETGPPIEIVQMERNVGYAAGINAGIDVLATREPDAVMVLNPDCRLRPGTLALMAEALSVPGRGIVAPKLLNLDGTLQPTLRRAPSVGGAVAEALLGGKLAGRIGLGELLFDEKSHDRSGWIAWATGAALLIAWRTIVEVGLWNESYLLYSEETDFIFRAADHGWTMWYTPTAAVDHRGGESSTKPQLAALETVNKVRLYRTRHGRSASTAYWLAVLFGTSLRALAGRRTAQASVAALLSPSRRITSLDELG
jgi:N-acetylglucosaminyl-diphospho-decaprenol L-rhamnosyltransferase